ncbi:MAG: hypothetical protein ACK5N8_04650 [Alphaproteobacteria bacterium]
MTVLDLLSKKHKINKHVIDVLTELYGQPKWLISPKEGQDPEMILNEWVKELGDYSEADLRRACQALFKYDKCKSFPTLAHIGAMLIDVPCQASKLPSNALGKSFCIEDELFKQDAALGKKFYTRNHYRRVFQYLLTSKLSQAIGETAYKALERSSEDANVVLGLKYKKALELGLFDEMDSLLSQSQSGGIVR